MSDTADRVEELEGEVKEFEDRVFMLEEQLASYLPLPEWGLSSTQSIIFHCLKEDRIASAETIRIALERIRRVELTSNSISVNLVRIRKQLAKHKAPYAIKSHYGCGWSLIKLEDTSK